MRTIVLLLALAPSGAAIGAFAGLYVLAPVAAQCGLWVIPALGVGAFCGLVVGVALACSLAEDRNVE